MKISYVGKKFLTIAKKEMSKSGRAAIYREADEGNNVYALFGSFALKVPAGLYTEILQPLTMREMPEPGAGFWCGNNAGRSEAGKNIQDIFENAKSACDQPAKITPYIHYTNISARIVAAANGAPVLVNDTFFDLFTLKRDALKISYSKRLNPLYIEDTFINAVICPIKPADSEIKILESLASYFAEAANTEEKAA